MANNIRHAQFMDRVEVSDTKSKYFARTGRYIRRHTDKIAVILLVPLLGELVKAEKEPVCLEAYEVQIPFTSLTYIRYA